MDLISEPWPWYISGPLIAVVMLLLLLAGKNFGMSANLRTLCTVCGAGRKASFFRFDWKKQRWNLVVLLGVIIGGFIASEFLSGNAPVAIHEDTVTQLEIYGFEDAGKEYMPSEMFAVESLSSPKTLALLILGGMLVGFGARYAGGCTSGHAISGLSDLQLPSLIAVIGFFIGGLIMVHALFPLIF